MSMLGDIFRNDDDGSDLEQVIEQDHEHDGEQSDNNNSHSEAEEDAPRRVDPDAEKKVKTVKNPRFVLNPKRLTGPRGVQIVENTFKDFKFLGKGHEKEDLDLVMKKLEHWSHRLYPKFQFDDCINKIESLGKKKEVGTHVRKIRLNMIFDDDQIVRNADDSDVENNVENEPIADEFDRLLEQQIALARSTPAVNSVHKTPSNFDSVLADSSVHQVNGDTTPVSCTSTTVDNSKTSVKMSEEQRQRMLQNRILAEQKRLAKIQKKNDESSNDIDIADVTVVQEDE